MYKPRYLLVRYSQSNSLFPFGKHPCFQGYIFGAGGHLLVFQWAVPTTSVISQTSIEPSSMGGEQNGFAVWDCWMCLFPIRTVAGSLEVKTVKWTYYPTTSLMSTDGAWSVGTLCLHHSLYFFALQLLAELVVGRRHESCWLLPMPLHGPFPSLVPLAQAKGTCSVLS